MPAFSILVPCPNCTIEHREGAPVAFGVQPLTTTTVVYCERHRRETGKDGAVHSHQTGNFDRRPLIFAPTDKLPPLFRSSTDDNFDL